MEEGAGGGEGADIFVGVDDEAFGVLISVLIGGQVGGEGLEGDV